MSKTEESLNINDENYIVRSMRRKTIFGFQIGFLFFAVLYISIGILPLIQLKPLQNMNYLSLLLGLLFFLVSLNFKKIARVF